MILASTSAAAADRFTPGWIDPGPTAPVYLIRAGTPIERELLEAEMAGRYGAGTVWPWDIQAALIAGIQKLASEGDRAELIALVQADFAGAVEGEEDRRKLIELKSVLRAHWPDYQDICMRMETRNAIVAPLAFAMFCVGWENAKADFATGIDGRVTPHAMKDIDPLHLRAAGMRAYDLLYVGSAEKNSDALWKSGDGPRTSDSPDVSATGGSSTESAI